MRRTIFALAITSIACGPEVVDAQDGSATGDESSVVPHDEYMAFDVRYPQGSTPTKVWFVWGIEVAAVGTEYERDLDWCEAERARQIAEYSAVASECGPITEMWYVPRPGGRGSLGTYRTKADCIADAIGACERMEL